VVLAFVTFLLALIVSGWLGAGRMPYIQIPAAVFLTTLAIWPLLAYPPSLMKRGFGDWVAYNGALMLVFGLIMWSARTVDIAGRLIGELSR
jgi:hypothetical protein